MAQQNNISTPVQVEEYSNSELLSTQRTLFRDWDPGSGIMIQPETVQASKGSGILEDRVRYTHVDPANGNPLEVQQENGMKTCYIWGYEKKLPVAKIENMAYSAIPAGLISAAETASGEAGMSAALAALRTGLPNAQVTTYTHRPLVGISTVTEPSGLKTSYEYDSFGRLKLVKDSDGRVLSQNQYHYKNQ